VSNHQLPKPDGLCCAPLQPCGAHRTVPHRTLHCGTPAQVSILREYLALELRPRGNAAANMGWEFDPERLYDDFVFMCFFVGEPSGLAGWLAGLSGPWLSCSCCVSGSQKGGGSAPHRQRCLLPTPLRWRS
jgi:hypothetical protein